MKRFSRIAFWKPGSSSGAVHQPISPCINAGANAYVMLTNDLDGNPRISDNKVDMGAYEFQGPPLSGFALWLWQYGLPTDGSGDYIDSDGDGLNNYQEWRVGTDPTDPNSVLRLTAEPSGSTILLQWQGASGVSYFLQCTTNLSSPFQSLVQPRIGFQVASVHSILELSLILRKKA